VRKGRRVPNKEGGGDGAQSKQAARVRLLQ
jgi:hypothetical protein